MSSYWSKEWYLDFSAKLAANISTDENCVGLILVGSTSDTSRVDEWSDHDFFVVTKNGEAEALRQDLRWLPYASEIAWAPRETAHGLKVVYNFGHVLEFAVFEDSELEIAKVNAATVTVDKTNITARVNAIREASHPSAPDWDAELELLLTHILIGVGRARRGEVLIAGQHTRSYLLGHALGLMANAVPHSPDTAHTEDNLNRFRRFELRYPQLGARLGAAMQSDVESGARQVLEILEEVANSPEHAAKFRVVRNRLGWA